MKVTLQALTKEEILHKELSHRELWMLKLNSQTWGPFLLEDLREYVQENEDLLTSVQASRLDPQEWMPLFSYPQFQRRSPRLISTPQNTEGPFWLLDKGLKIGPFEKKHVLKRLELKTLIVTDSISSDDGKTWLKIFEIEGFDRRDFAHSELPTAPTMTLAQMHGRDLPPEVPAQETPSEIIAEEAHNLLTKNKVLAFPTELASKSTKPSLWHRIDWSMPQSVAIGVIVLGGILFTLVAPHEETPSVAEITEKSQPMGERRAPASVSRQIARPQRTAPAINYLPQHNHIPTIVETHHSDQYNSNEHSDPDYGHYDEPETDPYDNPFDEQRIVHEASPVPSLVPPRGQNRAPSAAPIGDVMGYEENATEEASDF